MLRDATRNDAIVGATFQRYGSSSSLHSRIAATTTMLGAVPTAVQAAPIHPHVARGDLAQKSRVVLIVIAPF
jgi:hypothetical protein